jgi:uncharacterized protein (TIGR03437 family)
VASTPVQPRLNVMGPVLFRLGCLSRVATGINRGGVWNLAPHRWGDNRYGVLVSRLLYLGIAASALQAGTGALTYSTYLGGDGTDIIHAMAVDASNNVYLTGETFSSNFPVTAGALQKKHAGVPGTMTGILAFPNAVPDAFIVKLNAAGQIVYATYLGGAGADAGLGIAVDSAGSAYVVGSTSSQNFPVTPGAAQTHIAGNTDVFITKLSPDGSSLTYSTYLGGTAFDTAAAIALDSSNNVYVGGLASSDFPTTPGAYRVQGSGAFVAKLNPTGTALVYSTLLGDSSSGITSGIALDSAGNAYAGGSTSSSDFPTTPGAIRSTIGAGNSAAFLVKLNSIGSSAVYSAILGGGGYSFGGVVAVDSQGNAYVAGSTDAPDFPVSSGAFQTSRAGGADAFVIKLDPSGSALVYGTLLGGSGVDTAAGLAIDSAGNAFITGVTFSSDFPVTPDALPKRFAGSPCLLTAGTPFGNPPLVAVCRDAFAAKLDATGSMLTYSTYLSGSDSDAATTVAIGTTGTMYLAGWTRSNNFPTAGTAIADMRFPATCSEIGSPSSSQSWPCEDGFVARIDFTGPLAPLPLRVVNFGSQLETPVAPAEVATLFGAKIGPDSPATLQLDSSNQITTVLSGTRVLFDGVPAPLIRVDAGQITAIVPNSLAGKAHSLVAVERNGQITASTTVVIGAASPALLTFDPSGAGPIAAINTDGTINSPSNPASAGSIVSLFMIGAGATPDADGAVATAASNLSPSPVVVVGTQLALVPYAGPSPGSTAALTQINVRLPSQASGQVPVFVLANGFSSQFGATLSVK